MKVVVISGYFVTPFEKHPEYQDYCKVAKELGDYVIAIQANEKQIIRKYGELLKSNQMPVDENMTSIDKDNTVCETLEFIKNRFPNDKIYFLKSGGEYCLQNLSESKVLGVEFVFDESLKIASSSEILNLKKVFMRKLLHRTYFNFRNFTC